MTASDPAAGAPEPPARIDLYVSENSPDSALALENLRRAVQERSGENLPVITIIDVNASPLVAYREGIFVTPSLVVTADGISRTMFGNLSNPETTRALLARMLGGTSR